MRRILTVAVSLSLAGVGCKSSGPAPCGGTPMSEPRTGLTVEDLLEEETPPLLDLSYLARPDWADGGADAIEGSVALNAVDLELDFPETRALYAGEARFPSVTLDFLSRDGQLIPRERGLIATGGDSDSLWDVMVGTGATWREPGDGDWSRASFPLSLVDRYFNQVRNCVATFVYQGEVMSPAYVQCSQETADADDEQLGNIRALVPAAYTPGAFPDAAEVIEAHATSLADRLPTLPLSEWDDDGEIADYLEKSLLTCASTSVGAVYADGTLFVHPPQTRHGPYPYPSEMRHGVYSVTKSLAGALSMFYLAERYGEEVFEARIADHVPALAGRPEWQGVTFSHALNMATGTRGGEAADLLYEPLVLADTKEEAIANIAELGDAPEAPGQAFHYATTNTFVLSYALQHYVEEREGPGVRYWDLVRQDVLVPIGAGDLDLLLTRDEDAAERIPLLGFGARPTLDEAAKIALLIANEGEHGGQQLLHRGKIREALGRTGWQGYEIDGQHRYRHSFWSTSVRTGTCHSEVSYMQGHGANHVLLLRSDVIVLRFMDEFDEDIETLVRGVERVRSSCAE